MINKLLHSVGFVDPDSRPQAVCSALFTVLLVWKLRRVNKVSRV